MIIEQLASKVNELASQVIPCEHLESFLSLDLKAKLVGIMTFAHMAKDEEMTNFALKGIKYLEAQ